MPARRFRATLSFVISLLAVGSLGAEEPPVEPPPAPARSAVQGGGGDATFPTFDIYFPEGDFDLRLSRLVKTSFFEGQVYYNFVKGDITAFLRYRYYGYERVYQLAVFDEVEFDRLGGGSNDFERVRGTSFLVEWPTDFHRRGFLLTETDRMTSSKEELQYSTNRTNNFLRLGYQIGTPDDSRTNAILGTTREPIRRLFSAYRAIGPGGFGLVGALTYAFDALGGEFNYLKIEFDGLRRFRLPGRTFLIGRLHGGSFLDYETVRDDESLAIEDRLSIPLPEFFRLDGRDNLKGLDERKRGTDQLYTTLEWFVPWFEESSHPFLGLDWRTWYWVAYSGVGSVGFDRDVLTDSATYVPDAGLGFEAAFRLRQYTFFLSGLAAQALRGEGGIKARISLKSYH